MPSFGILSFRIRPDLESGHGQRTANEGTQEALSEVQGLNACRQ